MQAGLAARYYVDADTFRLEREGLFSRSWQLLGPAARVAASGHYLCANVAGINVSVTRTSFVRQMAYCVAS